MPAAAGRRARRPPRRDRSSGPATSATPPSSSTAPGGSVPRPASAAAGPAPTWTTASGTPPATCSTLGPRGRSSPASGVRTSNRAPRAGWPTTRCPRAACRTSRTAASASPPPRRSRETFTPVSNRPLVCPDYSATQPAFDPVAGRVGLPRRGRDRPVVVRRARRSPLPALPHPGQAVDDPDDPPQRGRHRHLRRQPRAHPRRRRAGEPGHGQARQVALPDHLARRLRRLPLPHDLAPLDVPPPGLAGHARARRSSTGRTPGSAVPAAPTTSRRPTPTPTGSSSTAGSARAPTCRATRAIRAPRTTRTSASARCTPPGCAGPRTAPAVSAFVQGLEPVAAPPPTETPEPTPAPTPSRLRRPRRRP